MKYQILPASKRYLFLGGLFDFIPWLGQAYCSAAWPLDIPPRQARQQFLRRQPGGRRARRLCFIQMCARRPRFSERRARRPRFSERRLERNETESNLVSSSNEDDDELMPKLIQLAEMRESGILSEEEFIMAKSKLLRL